MRDWAGNDLRMEMMTMKKMLYSAALTLALGIPGAMADNNADIIQTINDSKAMMTDGRMISAQIEAQQNVAAYQRLLQKEAAYERWLAEREAAMNQRMVVPAIKHGPRKR